MILTTKKYRAERGNCSETYQGLTATVEVEQKRNYVIVELDNLSRWRSKEEYADYLRWAADEIMKIPEFNTSIIARMRDYNAWRRGDDGIAQPDPEQLGRDIDTMIAELEAKNP